MLLGPINKMDGLCVGRGRDGQTLFHLEVNSLGKRISADSANAEGMLPFDRSKASDPLL
jgi:hypothetical protein